MKLIFHYIVAIVNYRAIFSVLCHTHVNQ